MTHAPGLHNVGNDDLKRLLRAIHHDAFQFPISRAGLVVAAFGDLEGDLGPLVGRDKAAAYALVTTVLRARMASSSSSTTPPMTQALWQGPPAPGYSVREPVDVAYDLVATAQSTVFLSGIATDNRARLLSILNSARRARGLHVTLVLRGDIQGARALLGDVFASAPPVTCWVAGQGQPQPPTCLSVDGQRLMWLSGDASFADDPVESALASGFVIEDPNLTQTMNAHLQALVSTAGYEAAT